MGAIPNVKNDCSCFVRRAKMMADMAMTLLDDAGMLTRGPNGELFCGLWANKGRRSYFLDRIYHHCSDLPEFSFSQTDSYLDLFEFEFCKNCRSLILRASHLMSQKIQDIRCRSPLRVVHAGAAFPFGCAGCKLGRMQNAWV